MKRRALIVTAVSASALFVGGAVAAGKQDAAKMCSEKMSGDKGAMMSSMPMRQGMMQGDVAKLADQLAESLSAIQAEKDPAALTRELAAHEALIKELQAKTVHMGMQNMKMGDRPTD